MFSLSGKVALVIVSSDGIVGAVAKPLHAQGPLVGGLVNREDAMESLTVELGERAAMTAAHLGNPKAVDGLIVKSVIPTCAPIDILISIPGVTKAGLSRA
jgi:hypothetical protein